MTASEHYRGTHPATATVSFVVVVGPDGATAIHPWVGDALLKLVTQGAPLHEAWTSQKL